ncbi:MAG: outer membrane protein assembly factor BamA [Candidatus Dependentiae bacterium]|nr:outer membrane protein assembly factor BamA [Candidatus Dependentiae bacterium]
MLRIPQRTSRILSLQIGVFAMLFAYTFACAESEPAAPKGPRTRSRQPIQQDRTFPTVHAVCISGNTLVGEGAIRAKIPFKPGDPFDARKTGTIIKDIYQLGYFTNVRLYRSDFDDGTVDLRIDVTEKPRISTMTFEGNNNFESEKIYKALEGSRIRALDEAEIPNICRQIEKAYQERHFHHVHATGSLIPAEDGTRKAHFVIEEGKKSWVKRVDFEGNAHIPDGTLRNKLFTRENWIFGFMDRAGTYHPDALMQDRYTVENFYQSSGYLTARVADVRVKEEDNGAINVTFMINEGDLYTVTKVEAPGNELLSERQLLARIPVAPGQLYSKDLIRSSMEIMRTLWGEFGYIYADVQPSIRPDEKTKTVEISFHSDLGNRIYLDRLDIVGNFKTYDKLIRREILFNEGDMLTKALMDESKRRVQLLGYFDIKDGVNWRIIKKNDNLANLELLLKEKKTGRFEGNIGWGLQPDIATPLSSFQAGVRAGDINMFGLGIRWNINATYSFQYKSIDAVLASDWLFDRPISGSGNAFLRDVLYEDFIQTDEVPHERTRGGFGQVGFRAERLNFLNVILGINYEDISYTHPNIARNLFPNSPAMQLALQTQVNYMFQPGKLLTFDTSLSQDQRNNPILPTAGFNWSWNMRLAIPYPGSPFAYLRNTFDGHWYTAIVEERDIVFHLRGFVGYAYLVRGKNIPYRELYHIGGPLTVRGFKYGQIGPQLLGSSIGALKAFFVTAEVQMPLTPDSNMRGYIFYDGGAGWYTPSTDVISNELLSNNSFEYRHAVGVSLLLDHPTPVRVDWGFKLDRKKRRGEEIAEVNISASRGF